MGLLLGMKSSDFTVSPLLLLRMTSAPVWMCLVMLICMLKDREMVDFILLSHHVLVIYSSPSGCTVFQVRLGHFVSPSLVVGDAQEARDLGPWCKAEQNEAAQGSRNCPQLFLPSFALSSLYTAPRGSDGPCLPALVTPVASSLIIHSVSS